MAEPNPIRRTKRFKDLAGQKFFQWTVVEFGGRDSRHNNFWVCRCVCGTVKWVRADDLIHNKTKSCGCIQRPAEQPAFRACNSCGNVLPFTLDYFYAHKQHPFGIRPKCIACCRKAAKRTRKPYMRRVRLEVLTHYSGGTPKCACCGEDRIEFLSIDHIDGGGSKHRERVKRRSLDTLLKRLGFPPGFRVLCHNCNFALGIFGYCPHDKERNLGDFRISQRAGTQHPGS